MITTIEGVYDNGIVTLKEKPIIKKKVKVFVMFTEENITKETPKHSPIKLRGAWKNLPESDKEQVEHYFDTVRNEWERDI